ncbi:hypothetical protein BZL39_M00370 [Zygosaccharomyces parabailii]|nr:hypothetical protein BZL39_M00370 [Zygosaccharomyces parabailii]CDH10496.1 uncharacterized protein ZBAI_02281 [Zygosaccharomyces bailii ISA1307]
MEKLGQLQSHTRVLDEPRDSTEQNPPPYAPFGAKRIMPVAYSLGEEGVMVFPSEEALSKYKHTNYEKDPIDPHGLGLPLFKLIRKHRFLRLGKKPHYVIYKYLLQKNGAPAPQGSEIFVSDGTHTVYRAPFCYVYRKKHSKLTNYVFEFLAELRARELELIDVQNEQRYCGSVGGYELLWSSPDDEPDEYELHMDLENVMRMITHDSLSEKEKDQRKGEKASPKEQQGPSVVASYSLENRDYLPKKHPKYGDLVFLEKSQLGNLETLGITSVPVVTQILACHGLILQQLVEKLVYKEEYQAEKNTPAAQYARRRVRERSYCAPRSEVWDSVFAD